MMGLSLSLSLGSNTSGVSGVGTVPFLSDSFTGTPGSALAAHTPEVGGAWSTQTISAGTIGATGTDVFGSSSILYHNAAAPPSANYYVEGVLTKYTDSSANFGITGRMNAAETDMYFARYADALGRFELYKATLAGGATMIGVFVSAFVAGTSRTLRLGMNSTAISVNVDGAQVISVIDGDITAAGFAGIRVSASSGASTGLHLDNLIAAAISAAPPAVSTTIDRDTTTTDATTRTIDRA